MGGYSAFTRVAAQCYPSPTAPSPRTGLLHRLPACFLSRIYQPVPLLSDLFSLNSSGRLRKPFDRLADPMELRLSRFQMLVGMLALVAFPAALSQLVLTKAARLQMCSHFFAMASHFLLYSASSYWQPLRFDCVYRPMDCQKLEVQTRGKLI